MATITGTDNAERLPGTDSADTINAKAGADTLVGGAGNDTMNGGSGDDVFEISGFNFGSDLYRGDDGADEIRLVSNIGISRFAMSSSTVSSVETLNMNYYGLDGTGGADFFDISAFSYITYYRRIDLYDDNDRFYGYQGDDEVDGGVGDDTLNGSAGSDELTGGGGNDSLIGGTGNDVFYLAGTDIGQDIFDGGSGADQIVLNGNLTLSSLRLRTTNVISTETLNLNYYSISGTGGNDSFDIGGVSQVTYYRTIAMLDGNDRFYGHAGADDVDGGAMADTLNGAAGDDELTGGSGDDSLIGGSGNDTFLIGGSDVGRDVYDGGSGTDQIRLVGNITGSISFTTSNVIGVESLNFNYYGIDGSARSDVIDFGGVRSVSIYQQIDLDDGNDTFRGHIGADRVDGDSGNDTISGAGGADSLVGGSGSDLINGGTGRDTLSGGEGADRFRFTVSDSSDLITDWTDGQDKIVIAKGKYDGVTYDSFGDLDIESHDGYASIRFGNTYIRLDGVDGSDLTSADFTFV